MKIAVVGSGGREHAITRTLLRSPQVERVFCIPGNGGTATTDRCQNLALGVDDFPGIGQFCSDNQISLVVVGPELPLSQGITDYLQQQQIPVFGPTQAGAQIESSKAWAKALMATAEIPTAFASVFTDANTAKAYVQTGKLPIVIKADGLAAGKGVTVATTLAEAEAAIDAAMTGKFGAAGSRLLIEECLYGQEVSILALTDGQAIIPLLSAQDHKRIGEGDTGPNTGGMGAYAPAPIITPNLMQRIHKEILSPAVQAMADRGIVYRGVLYAGLMITPSGDPKVIEFNCRFGDPEIQAILPLLETPLAEILYATATGRLAKIGPIAWKEEVSACVVLAANGYPESYEKGKVITGIDRAEASGAIVFQAGSKLQGEQLLTNGGRVLNIVATDSTFEQAFARAYAAVDCIEFAGMYCRRDIGHRVIKP
ncbi:MAG: phosphoribosylamine--glycine ligase [Hormoscilla sp.]